MLTPALRGASLRRLSVLVLGGLLVTFACSRNKKPHSTTGGDEGGGGVGATAVAGGRTDAGRSAGGAAVEAAGGAGGASGASPSWLTDSSAWEALTTLPGCRVRLARDAAKTAPKL